MRYLELEEVLILHSYQISTYGGADNIRDLKLLESALSRPQTQLSGKDMFESVSEKATIYAIGIIQNHPFIDGNKRTGIHAMLTFLELNNVFVEFNSNEIVKLAYDIANREVTIKEVESFIIDHLVN